MATSIKQKEMTSIDQVFLQVDVPLIRHGVNAEYQKNENLLQKLSPLSPNKSLSHNAKTWMRNLAQS